ncbi:MAG TPA: glutamate racemase, partial [Oxalicibacterium sp.]|nr:glutamate racemase [Oxalicibacterium sp.]
MAPSKKRDPVAAEAPIGIFDSGVGALSVLRHIQARLPSEHLLCFCDSGHAPYGGKPDAEIIDRTLAIAAFLKSKNVKAIVVACNTATAAGIEALRAAYPALIVVGVEPGLKPAAVFSRSGKAGVLATASTLASSRFIALRDQISVSTGVSFFSQACVGLVEQIEKGELNSPETTAMLERYVTPILRGGADTIALGCTHYPFVQPAIEAIAQRESSVPVTIIDTGEAVARQLERLLQLGGLQRMETREGSLQAFTTGSRAALVAAFF